MYKAVATAVAFCALSSTAQKCIQPGWRNLTYVRTAPGPESIDYTSDCQPWSDNTCCTAQYTKDLAGGIGNIYPGFSYDFCGAISPKCRQFMYWEECFYACDPYAAYYEDPAIPGSFKNLPMCQNFCDDWFDACKDDYTCVADWSNWFPEANGTYACPAGSTCKKFSAMYGTGTQMCTNMWGSNFKVEKDPKKCFAPWFYSTNPNAPAAGLKASGVAAQGASAAAALVGAIAVTTLVWPH